MVEGLDAELLDAVRSNHGRRAPDLPDADLIAHALRQLGVEEPGDVESMLSEIPSDRLAALKPVQGAAEAVREIRKRVGKLGALTSGTQSNQCEKLRLLGVEDLLDVVVTSDETGLTKGEREIYEVAARRLGVEPSQTWMVGDSLDWDVACSQEAGMTGVWVVWPASKFREMRLRDCDLPQNSGVIPDLIVKRLQDLLPYLE